jgi:hypothetical protein
MMERPKGESGGEVPQKEPTTTESLKAYLKSGTPEVRAARRDAVEDRIDFSNYMDSGRKRDDLDKINGRIKAHNSGTDNYPSGHYTSAYGEVSSFAERIHQHPEELTESSDARAYPGSYTYTARIMQDTLAQSEAEDEDK